MQTFIMRYLVSFLFAFIAIDSLAQSELAVFNAYKSITFYEVEGDDLNEVKSSSEMEYLKNSFQDMGFLLAVDSIIYQPEVYGDICSMLYCKILRIKNGTYIMLQNCLGDVVYQKSYAGDYAYSQEENSFKAAVKFIKQFRNFDYHFDSTRTPKFPTVEQTGMNEETIREYLSNNRLDEIEGIYKTYDLQSNSEYQFAVIKRGNDFKAIIIDCNNLNWKPGEVKATIQMTAARNVFSASWCNLYKSSEKAVVKLESDALLSIELKDEKLTFIKLFPTQNDNQESNKSPEISATGSGFALSKEGMIATNAHVVQNSKKIEVVFTNDTSTLTFNAKILLLDKNNDVALLSISDDKFKGFNSIPYGLSEKAAIGSDAFTIGFPLNNVMGTAYKVTNGIVSSTSGIDDDLRYYQITVPLQPGNSGGPLFDKNGNVIGITSAKLNEKAVGTSVENVNYAIKSAYLSNLCNMLPESIDLTPKLGLQGKSLEEQIRVLKNYVCLIKVY
jgi:S1-C subfamily serine protease